MSENSLEKKLSETNWTNERENNIGFSKEEMEIFMRISNDISHSKESLFHDLEEELKFYRREEKQFLVHTRNKLT